MGRLTEHMYVNRPRQCSERCKVCSKREALATELVREGALVSDRRAPQCGKSLCSTPSSGEKRAILSPICQAQLAMQSKLGFNSTFWPLRLVDTAGLRQTDELVERLGIDVSERYLERPSSSRVPMMLMSSQDRRSSYLRRIRACNCTCSARKADR